ncbi:MAG: hypothetical protein QM775_30940 [Pirellulales bacterium]
MQLWFSASPTIPAGLESVVFATAASIAAGMILSAVRWLVIDTMMEFSGIRRPDWNDTQFETKREAFEVLVDAHFRYYQFYAHMALALPLFAVHAAMTSAHPLFVVAVAGAGVSVLVLAARDSLSKYFTRTSRLLDPQLKGKTFMTNGHRKNRPAKDSGKTDGTPKPTVPKTPKGSAKSK